MGQSRRRPTRHVTLLTIADRLGVSRTTVSNAYSRPDQLTPALREQIFAVAKELGYAGPHPAARGLRRGRAGAIGILLTESLGDAFTDPAAVLFLQGVAEVSAVANIGLLLLPSPPGDGLPPAAVHEAVVDGFLVYSVFAANPGLGAILDRRLPTVIVDEPRRGDVASVGIDDRACGRALAEHLLTLGHRRFAAVVDRLAPDDYRGFVDANRRAAAIDTVVSSRLQGVADALAAADLVWDEVLIYECAANNQDAGRAAGIALLDRRPRPTAILAFSDQLALGVLRAARDRAVGVPDALSVTGFDDISAARAAQPSLTTIRQPLLDKGRTAGRLLLASQSGEEPPRVILPTKLIVRSSTGPAPSS